MSHTILYIALAPCIDSFTPLRTQHSEIDVIQRYYNRALENLSTMCGAIKEELLGLRPVSEFHPFYIFYIQQTFVHAFKTHTHTHTPTAGRGERTHTHTLTIKHTLGATPNFTVGHKIIK